MLIQFSIENHRSIKDSAVISFAASKDKSLESYLLHPDEKRALLPAIAIYGANAAGKSNVLHALMTMKDMVVGEAAKISKGQKLPWEAPQRLHLLRSYSSIMAFVTLTAILSMLRRSIRSICTTGPMGVRR